MYGVTPDDFMNNPNLGARRVSRALVGAGNGSSEPCCACAGSTFRILSTNADREGRVFVSSIEAFSIPIYGTQYHAEKVRAAVCDCVFSGVCAGCSNVQASAERVGMVAE
jgi:hypothetical protein